MHKIPLIPTKIPLTKRQEKAIFSGRPFYIQFTEPYFDDGESVYLNCTKQKRILGIHIYDDIYRAKLYQSENPNNYTVEKICKVHRIVLPPLKKFLKGLFQKKGVSICISDLWQPKDLEEN